MPVLIDGHNLIGALPTIHLSDPDDEWRLVLLLRRYANHKRPQRSVVVVFDHGRMQSEQNFNGYGVTCVFVQLPQTADDELLRRIRTIQRPAEWSVVSSDRAVEGEARARKIRVVSAQEFSRQMQTMTTQPRVDKRDKFRERPLSSRDIDEWMRLFGESDDDDVKT